MAVAGNALVHSCVHTGQTHTFGLFFFSLLEGDMNFSDHSRQKGFPVEWLTDVTSR